ncbi:unnamed protein product [Zymoseptoria tritici ST99CH_3D7]|uniref:Uncharacterized protein n=1 Tax=Zymoseptoria tritici (strain ST99CH_3D7) TaxID=1276538 RepID=A0A1X7RK47_ZYMT9|nr:unnamed protein product [Zymoseptoria tritici ST99CH_3D7]
MSPGSSSKQNERSHLRSVRCEADVTGLVCSGYGQLVFENIPALRRSNVNLSTKSNKVAVLSMFLRMVVSLQGPVSDNMLLP